jgi:hypothetical protein
MKNDLSKLEYYLFLSCLVSGISVGPISTFTPLKGEAYVWFGAMPAIISMILGNGLQVTGGSTRGGRHYRKEYKADLYFFGGIYIGGASFLLFRFLHWIYSQLS